MQSIIHTNAFLDVNNVFMIRCIQLVGVQRLFRCDYCDRQQSVNDFDSYTFGNHWAALAHTAKVNVLVGVIVKKTNDTLIATF